MHLTKSLSLLVIASALSAAGQAPRDTVYLNPSAGSGDGKSPERPARALPAGYSGKAGVTMLYKRGSVLRGDFPIWSGTQQAPVVVGAYGQGEKPLFMKSIRLMDPADWIRESGNIWRSAKNLKSRPAANVVYNDGEYCGAMRWSKAALAKQGDWFMYDTAGHAIKTYDNIYIYSTANPAAVYRSLEYVPTGHFHVFGTGHAFMQVQDIHIRNAGTHGFRFQDNANHITIRRCDISYIGGAPFTPRIGINGVWVRYGNAVEVWGSGKYLTIEQCRLWENYDASFVVQGSCGPACMDSIVIRRNIMWNAGFDHFDQFWGKGVSRVHFENNTCLNAGGGWPYLTEGRPRLSEFLPDSVGWHIDLDSNGLAASTLYIRNNIFANAAANRLVKLPTLLPGGWGGTVIDYNLYYQADAQDPIAQFGERVFPASEMSRYRAATGQEAHGVAGDPLFVDPDKGDYRLRRGSPAIDAAGPIGEGMDFSDSIAGFRGKAGDMGAWEYSGAASVGLRAEEPGLPGRRDDIRIEGNEVVFRHPSAAWARCEITGADGARIRVEAIPRGAGAWAFRAKGAAGHALIRIRTDKGDYFRYGRF